MSHSEILCLSPRSAALRFPARGCARRRRAHGEASFTIDRDELVTFTEPEGSATFQWILAHS